MGLDCEIFFLMVNVYLLEAFKQRYVSFCFTKGRKNEKKDYRGDIYLIFLQLQLALLWNWNLLENS